MHWVLVRCRGGVGLTLLFVTGGDWTGRKGSDEAPPPRSLTAAETQAVETDKREVTFAPLSFVADRPFVVAIRENHSGTILFLGTVMDPAAG